MGQLQVVDDGVPLCHQSINNKILIAMKNILIPSDFSDCAANALEQAVRLALRTRAHLHVLHVHHPEVVVSAMPVGAPYYETLPTPQVIKDKVQDIKTQLSKVQGLQYTVISKIGSLVDVLEHEAKSHKVDLVIMGTNSAEDPLTSWLGTNTAHVMELKKWPVLVIPKNFHKDLSQNSKIVFATDFDKIHDWDILKPIHQLALASGAEIEVFVVRAPHMEASEKQNEKDRFEMLSQYFTGVRTSFHYSYHSDVVHTVEKFAKAQQAGLVVMISHQRGLLEGLFHKSISKEMALHSKLALLAIPDTRLQESNVAVSSGVGG